MTRCYSSSYYLVTLSFLPRVSDFLVLDLVDQHRLLLTLKLNPIDRAKRPRRAPVRRQRIDEMRREDDLAGVSDAVQPAGGVDDIADQRVIQPLLRADVADHGATIVHADAHADVAV